MLLGFAAALILGMPLSGHTETPASPPKAGWVFYGMLLNPVKDGHWDQGSPNFSIADTKNAASPVPKSGEHIVCVHAMSIRDACLAINDGAPGTYQWGAKTGKSLQPGEKAEIVSVKSLPSKKGVYLWVQIKTP